MAYFIFNQNQLYKIAADDTAKNKILEDISNYTEKTVSTADFNRVRLNEDFATLDANDNIVFEPTLDAENRYTTSSQLQGCINNIKKYFEAWLVDHSNHPDKQIYADYLTTLESFDVSTVTLPTDDSWEKYCNDNSITFYHPLQLP